VRSSSAGSLRRQSHLRPLIPSNLRGFYALPWPESTATTPK